MGKLDGLRQVAGANVDESLGKDRPAPRAPGQGGVPTRYQGVEKLAEAYAIPVDRIVRDETQPREEFDEDALDRLAESLRIRGQLQPIRVRWDEGKGAYVVIAGERRWRAASRAGLAKLQAIVVDRPMADDERLIVQIVENALRDDLKPVEQAKAYRRLIEARGYSTRELAAELHVGQTTVVRTLALLDLAPEIQEQVDRGDLHATAAAEIAKVEEPGIQVEVAKAVVEQGLRRSEVTELVSALRAKRPTPAARPEPVTIDLGDGIAVKVTWKKASSVDVVKALRLALKRVQSGAGQGEAA